VGQGPFPRLRPSGTHHDPDHNDEFLLRVEEECQRHFPRVVLAREKMAIEL
jgi:hypothetical protein